MKKLLGITILLLFWNNVSHATTENVYLKCKEIVTKNQIPQTNLLYDTYKEGTILTLSFASIHIKNSSAKIAVYRPIEDGKSMNEGFNKKIPGLNASGIPKKIKAIVNDNYYTYEFLQDEDVFKNVIRYEYVRNKNEWSLKLKNMFKYSGGEYPVHLEWLAKGECTLLDKKIFKKKIKKGINDQDF